MDIGFREEVGSGEVEDGKGGEICGARMKLWVMSKQCNIQMMYYNIVHLKLI